MSTTTTARKETALSYPHIRRLRFLMWTLGAWPLNALGECEQLSLAYRCYRKIPVFSNMFFTLGVFHYLYYHSKDLDYTVLGMCVVTTFFGIITLMHETVNKLSYYTSMCSISMMVVNCILFNVSPIYPNYKNGVYSGNEENVTLAFTIFFSYPGFDPNDWFTLVTLIDSVLCFFCVGLVTGVDLLLYLIVFQIVGHILILKNSLKEFPTPQKPETTRIWINKSQSEIIVKTAMFDDDENGIVHHKLVECIQHHKFIVSFTDDVSELFGPVLAVTYGMQLMTCCILLLECTNGDTGTIISFVPTTINIFAELILISVVFEVIGTVSEQLKDSVYGIPWECMNTKNRRTVNIFLQRVQTPIIVTALKTVPIGVVAMAQILKTTFSYFALLKSLE